METDMHPMLSRLSDKEVVQIRELARRHGVVVHDYFGVALDIVWDVVRNHVPPLREKLRRALEN